MGHDPIILTEEFLGVRNMNRKGVLGSKKVFAAALLALFLFVSVSFGAANDPNTSGIDSVWYRTSAPVGWSPSPIDPNNTKTLALAASGPESVFAIQEEDGVTKLVHSLPDHRLSSRLTRLSTIGIILGTITFS